MRVAARTPEELSLLLEDALLMGDLDVVEALFEERALFVADDGQARGSGAIARLAMEISRRGSALLADPGRVLQAQNTALVVVGGGVDVVQRGADGAWRYAISMRSERRNG